MRSAGKQMRKNKQQVNGEVDSGEGRRAGSGAWKEGRNVLYR